MDRALREDVGCVEQVCFLLHEVLKASFIVFAADCSAKYTRYEVKGQEPCGYVGLAYRLGGELYVLVEGAAVVEPAQSGVTETCRLCCTQGTTMYTPPCGHNRYHIKCMENAMKSGMDNVKDGDSMVLSACSCKVTWRAIREDLEKKGIPPGKRPEVVEEEKAGHGRKCAKCDNEMTEEELKRAVQCECGRKFHFDCVISTYEETHCPSCGKLLPAISSSSSLPASYREEGAPAKIAKQVSAGTTLCGECLKPGTAMESLLLLKCTHWAHRSCLVRKGWDSSKNQYVCNKCKEPVGTELMQEIGKEVCVCRDCLMQVREADKAIRLACGHRYHTECSRGGGKLFCSICRADISTLGSS